MRYDYIGMTPIIICSNCDVVIAISQKMRLFNKIYIYIYIYIFNIDINECEWKSWFELFIMADVL